MTPPHHNTFPTRTLLACLLVAVIARGLLLATGSVSFHADEGIVALMARHITQGEHMVFFYGQEYMGSLNAYTTALGFALMGESVAAIRAVQFVKQIIAVGVMFWSAWHISRHRTVAAVAALFIALPPTLGVIYTATNIGGYVETLTFGALLLALGHDITGARRGETRRWALFGFVAGVAWWTNGLIVVYGFPVAVGILWNLMRHPQRSAQLGRLGVAVVLFVVGGLPWWWHTFAHNFQTIAVYVPALADTTGGGIELGSITLTEKLLGIVLFALPTATGLRYTWETSYYLPLLGLPVLFLHLITTYQLIRQPTPPLARGARPLVLGVGATLLAVFIGTSFGVDPTGRYFLPMLTVMALTLGTFTATLQTASLPRGVWLIPVALVLGYNTLGAFDAAIRNDPGITTQFELAIHIPHDHDDALIEFLRDNDLRHGYTTYWVAIRAAFLSDEELQYSSALPYKPDLSYNPTDNRYPPYAAATENATRIAYINTTFRPELDAVLRAKFAEAGVTYRVERIGYFVVYYDFVPDAPRIRFDGDGM
jgi:hypothetical protein